MLQLSNCKQIVSGITLSICHNRCSPTTVISQPGHGPLSGAPPSVTYTPAVDFNGTDVDGDPLVYTVVASREHGTLRGTGPNLLYMPAAKFIGSDRLSFQVSDGQVTSGIADVSISVTILPFADFLPMLKR